ncbi:Oxidoreductase [Coelomomyces lativittatus]|nr:Oxidoreductase [Coelomomyces lativittatus]KAJ1515205.1 Oxidoreductase [Coelomomyces lativittatus]KAJ1516431.1 Oxidoreductase [Coelomomyces lativittatus]
MSFSSSPFLNTETHPKDEVHVMTKHEFMQPEPVTSSSSTSPTTYEGAITPTGEINWDCPCLQGMAHGPCGPSFRTAFSCFVYSTEEPKGMECLVPFQAMQECFKAHPEIYSEELSEETFEEDGEHQATKDETEGEGDLENKDELQAQHVSWDDIPKVIPSKTSSSSSSSSNVIGETVKEEENGYYPAAISTPSSLPGSTYGESSSHLNTMEEGPDPARQAALASTSSSVLT